MASKVEKIKRRCVKWVYEGKKTKQVRGFGWLVIEKNKRSKVEGESGVTGEREGRSVKMMEKLIGIEEEKNMQEEETR